MRKTFWILVLLVLFALVARYAHGQGGYVGPQPILETEPMMAYVTAIYVPTPPKPVPKKSTYSSCVLFVKALTGYSKSVGWGNRWPVNSTEPSVGAVVVFKYAHVSYIQSMSSDSFIVIEANFIKDRISTRSLMFDDPSIKGYWIPE